MRNVKTIGEYISTQRILNWLGCHYFLKIFFILLPFTYSLQVIYSKRELGAIPYIILVAEICVLILFKWKEIKYFNKKVLSIENAIVYLIVQNFVSFLVVTYNGDYEFSIRVLLIYFLPYFIIYIIAYSNDNTVSSLIGIIGFTGIIVATELTYESIVVYFQNDTTYFQLKSFNYVKNISSQELTRLYATNYRPTGLIEHIHASVFYVG